MSLTSKSTALNNALNEMAKQKKELDAKYKQECARLDFRTKLSTVLCQEVPDEAITALQDNTFVTFRFSAQVEDLVFRNTWMGSYGIFLHTVGGVQPKISVIDIGSLSSLGYCLNQIAGKSK